MLPTPEQRAARFRRRRWVLGLAVVAVLAAAVGGAVVLRGGDDGRDRRCPDDEDAVDVIVFLRPEVGPEEVDAVQAALERSEVSDLRYVSAEEAQAEAEDLFADDETVVETLPPGDVPTSFRATVPEPADADRLAVAVEPLPGVLSVETATEAVAALC